MDINVAMQAIINRTFRKKIIQFSPPRSGSTLVFNILQDVLPGTKIKKRHKYSPKDCRFPIVVTYRHPLDCIASSIQRHELILNDDVIREQIREFEQNGIGDVLKIKDNDNVLLLRYEDFWDNYVIIYNALESFFDITISTNQRRQLTNRYQIKSVEKVIESMESFNEHDAKTKLHGNHISKYKGKPYYYKDFFAESHISILKEAFSEFMAKLEYT